MEIDPGVVRPLRVALFSTLVNGGAGGAALGIHRSLLANGVQSRLICRNLEPSVADVPGVVQLSGFPRFLADHAQPSGSFRRQGYSIFSIDTDGIAPELVNEAIKDADVISLQSYARFLSNRNIAALTRSGKPVVFTIHDMHPLAGGCHFFYGCNNWQSTCLPCPQFLPGDVHLPHFTLEEKQSAWDMANVAIVVLSDHTRRIVERSPLFGHCRIEKIPNPIDISIFRPISKADARSEFKIPDGKRAIAYLPSNAVRVKGFVEFADMLRLLSRRVPPKDYIVLSAGVSAEFESEFQTLVVGHISDRAQLARLYRAADVTVIPSLEETFSLTAAESIASGTPVAGFATGAIPEMARHECGKAVPIGNVQALADAAAEILLRSTEDPGWTCHAYAAERFSYEKVGRQYSSLFEELVNARVSTLATVRSDADDLLRTELEKTGEIVKYLAQRHAHAAQQISQQEYALASFRNSATWRVMEPVRRVAKRFPNLSRFLSQAMKQSDPEIPRWNPSRFKRFRTFRLDDSKPSR